MRWLSRLEMKYNRYSVTNLTFYLIGLNVAVYIISFLFLSEADLFVLFPDYVLKGQIWRLITFAFLPPSANPIYVFLELYLLYIIGTSLENYWGRFKLNIYYLTGFIITIIAAFIQGPGVTGLYLNMSLFLAYATLFPDQEMLMFFVLPVKVKYLGYLEVAFAVYQIIIMIRAGAWYMVAAIIASFVNYLIFFGVDMINWIKQKTQVHSNRKRFFDQVRPFNRDRRY